jgi:hypothetical protein
MRDSKWGEAKPTESIERIQLQAYWESCLQRQWLTGPVHETDVFPILKEYWTKNMPRRIGINIHGIAVIE